MRTRVKFCGITSLNDARLAVDAGADAIGLIFAESPRRIDLELAQEIVASLPPFVTPVGIFVDPGNEELQHIQQAIPRIVLQLSYERAPRHPEQSTSRVWSSVIEVISLPRGDVSAHSAGDDAARDVRAKIVKSRVEDEAVILFDTKVPGLSGGTGTIFAWEMVAPIARERRIGIAGGLTPENVGACIEATHPYFVDVRSGVETGGKKDAEKMRAFIAAVRNADEAFERERLHA